MAFRILLNTLMHNKCIKVFFLQLSNFLAVSEKGVLYDRKQFGFKY